MAVVSNTADGGTSGTVVTIANSGGASGTAFDVVTGTEVYKFSNVWAHSSPLSYLISGTTAGQAVLGWGTGLVSPSAAFRFYVRFTAAPSGAVTFAQVRTGTGNSCWFNLTPTPTLKIAFNTDGNGLIDTYSGTLALNTTYRIEMLYRSSSTTTEPDGLAQWAIYAGDSTTPLQAFTKSDALTKSGVCIGARFGKLTTAVTMGTTYFDNIIWDDGGTTFVGPVGVPPSAVIASRVGKTQIDTTGSSGLMTLTQTGGPVAANISGPVAGVFTITHPTPFLDTMAFLLAANAEGLTDSEVILIDPAEGPMDEKVYNGTAWI